MAAARCALQLSTSMTARTAPSSQKLSLPVNAAFLSFKVLKESNSNSGGENKSGWPASITLSRVEPERGAERTKMAGGFFTAGPFRRGASGFINRRIWATLDESILV